MNEQRFITVDGRPNIVQRGGSVIGRLPLTGRIHAVREGAFVRPFLFFMSAAAVMAGIYFFALAVPIYTSDMQIAVRGKQALTTSPLLAALSGSAPGIPESTALTHYVESVGMLDAVDASQHLRRQYSRFRPDFLYHMSPDASKKHFLAFFASMIDVSLDTNANIITIRVRSFTPQDAHATASAIMHTGSEYVGKLSAQMLQESTRAAQEDVDSAKADSIKAHVAIAQFQGKSGNLDPSAYGTAATGAMFSLDSNIAQLRSQLASLRTYSTDRSPQVVQLQAQISQLQVQKGQLQQKVIGQQNSGTIVGQLGSFQTLTINQTYADQRLVAAQAALDQAKSVAQQRQLFVVPITEPTLPDEPTPRALWGFLTVMAVCACLYTIGRLALASIRDHQV